MNIRRQPSGAGHPRLEPLAEPSLQRASDLAQRNRWIRRILLSIMGVLVLATLLAGIRW